MERITRSIRNIIRAESSTDDSYKPAADSCYQFGGLEAVNPHRPSPVAIRERIRIENPAALIEDKRGRRK